jgi:hypothetical protein
MRKTCLTLTLALAGTLAAASADAQLQLQANQTLSQQISALRAQGWRETAPGLVQRSRAGFVTETLAYGSEGLAWAIRETDQRLRLALDRSTTKETPELLAEIEALSAALAALEAADPGPSANEMRNTTTNCTFSFGAAADAYATTWVQGVGGSSSSSYSTGCAEYPGSVWASNFGSTATGYASWGQGRYGTNVSIAGSVNAEGGPDCYSEAFASVNVQGINLFYSAYDNNFTCPTAPPTVSISGLSFVSIWGYDCAYLTWTANASGGTPGYTYSWTIDGAYVGGGSSYSQWYCGSDWTYNDVESVNVVVTDAANQPATAGFQTNIYYRQEIYDECGPYRRICYYEPINGPKPGPTSDGK